MSQGNYPQSVPQKSVTQRLSSGRIPPEPSRLQRGVMRRASTLLIFEVLLGGLDVSAKVSILLSLLDI
jgi:hypothetical protein